MWNCKLLPRFCDMRFGSSPIMALGLHQKKTSCSQPGNHRVAVCSLPYLPCPIRLAFFALVYA